MTSLEMNHPNTYYYCLLAILTAFLHTASALYGPNVCSEQQNYTMTTRVKYQQPVSVKTYKWCLGIPPRCSSYHVEMKERWKVQTALRTKTVELCCEGFEEDEERCVPKCPAGFTGEFCDQGCALEKWGPSCTEDCECPENSICNVKNGSCICLEGWYGTSCNLPLLQATRMPFPRIDKEVLKKTNLFDWNPPTMADVQTTERHVTYKNFILTNTAKIMPVTTSTEKSTTEYLNNISSIRPIVDKDTFNITTLKPISTSKKVISTTAKQIILTTSKEKQFTYTNKTSTAKVNVTDLRKIVSSTTRSYSTTKSSSTTTRKNIQNKISTTRTPILISTSKSVSSANNSATEKNIISSTVKEELIKTTTISKTTPDKISETTTTSPKLITTNKEIVNTTVNITKLETVTTVKTKNITESVDDKQITLKTENTLKSQIESPNTVTLSVTTSLPDNINTTEINTEKSINKTTTFATTTTKDPITTTRRKPIKQHKSESDIITLHTFVNNKNDTSSKIFKTITLPPVSNTTQKMPHQKGKVYHESKMITIPVRVIIDSEKSPSNIYFRKGNNGSESRRSKFVTSFPMFTLDVQTEETKHVLTEPEQITSIAGSDDDFENRDDLLSIMTISIGVMLIIILTATIIVLVTRYRQIKAEKLKDMEMDHVQSMMNVSEDDVQSGYLRSVFHSPLPDPPSQIIAITKPAFSTPYIQSTLSRPVTPALLESFRDILECHYDHPKPPRPTSTPMRIQISDYQVPPSMYQHLNTFRTCSMDANQIKITSDDISLPVTDAAITVLKLEHQSSSQPVGIENKEPLYDEIPPWVSETPRNLNKIMYSNDEALTEL